MLKYNIVYNPATDYRFDIAKEEGSFIWDTAGKKYIDFSSGWNTTNLGWNNKEIAQAIIAQTAKSVYAPMWSADAMQITYAQALTAALPEKLNVVCRATGGTEANELALKIARAVTGRQQIISFAHTYHGQSFGTLALGYIPDYVKQISPLVPEIIQIAYPNKFTDNQSEETVLKIFLDNLESHLKTQKIAAVFTEAGLITGWGSMLEAPKGYLKAVRELTQKYGTLLVVDEVGTGFSRTGKLFAIEHEQVVPDIITLAKGISNGAAPIGAVVTNDKLIEKHIGEFKPTSTFGWTPLTCAVALKTLEIHQRDEIWLEAERKGTIIKHKLQKAAKTETKIKNIRGWGMELAFDVNKSDDHINDDALAAKVVQKAFEKGLHLGDAGACIQLMPPLTIDDTTLDEGLDILMDVVKNI